MKKITFNSTATIYESTSELEIEDFNLIQKAVEARSKAYSPYSKFSVGCAILLENGKIVLGNNQENAAYPSGMCAERVAIWKASSEYPNITVKKLPLLQLLQCQKLTNLLVLVELADKHYQNTKSIKNNQ